jgi:tetratricopeptide (TPR) repeat protein
MAKRVNTRFVVRLSVTVAAAAIGATWHVHARQRRQDPDALRAVADAAAAAGQWEAAADAYDRAAAAALRRRRPAADLLAKAADAADRASAEAATPAEAARAYRQSADALARALREDPRNPALLQMAAAALYARAAADPTPAAWAAVDEAASRLLDAGPPGAPALLWRAEARLRTPPPAGREADLLAAVWPDVAAAQSLAPASGTAAALAAEVRRRQAAGCPPAEAADRLAAAAAAVRVFLADHPFDPEATRALAAILLQQGDSAGAAAACAAAFDHHPDNLPLATELARLYAGDSARGLPAQPAKAEAVCRAAAAASPASAPAQLLLAEFYLRERQPAAALPAYAATLAAAARGGGPLAVVHERIALRARFASAAACLDLAEAAGPATAAGQRRLADARQHAEQFRAAHGPPALADLLGGRTALLADDLPQAEILLKRAAAGLAGTDPPAALRQAKVLLAAVYRRTSPPQLGAALALLEEAAAAPGGSNGPLAVERADVLLRLGRPDDAEALLAAALQAGGLPADEGPRAQALYAAARARQGKAAGKAPAESAAVLLQKADAYLAGGDNRLALDAACRALRTGPPTAAAWRAAVVAYVRLAALDDARAAATAAAAAFPEDAAVRELRDALAAAATAPDRLLALALAGTADDYLRAVQAADWWHALRRPDDELRALDAADAALPPDGPSAARRRADLAGRRFLAAWDAARSTSDAAARGRYAGLARAALLRAAAADADGFGGALFQGLWEGLADPARGLATLEHAVAARPDSAAGLQRLGQAYTDDADRWSRAAETGGPGADAPRQRAAAAADRAIDAFRRAARLAPTDIPLVLSAAGQLARRGAPADLREAQDLLTGALRAAPADGRLADAADGLLPLEAAVAVREPLQAARPWETRNLRRLAALYLRDPGGPPARLQAAAGFLRPLAEGPAADLDDVALLAAIYTRLGRTDAAVQLFEPAAASPDPARRLAALIRLAALCDVAGRADQAHHCYAEAADLEGRGGEAEHHWADWCFARGQFAEAAGHYAAVADRSPSGPTHLPALARLAEALWRAGQLPAADDRAGQLLAASPRAEAGLLVRAAVRIEQGRPRDAVADLDALLAGNPSHAEALYLRARARLADGAAADAIDDLTALAGRGGPRAALLLAQACHRAGRFAEAVDAYAAVTTAGPQPPAVWRDYAHLLMALARAERRLPPAAADDFALALRRLRPADRLAAVLPQAATAEPTSPEWPLMAVNLQELAGHAAEAAALALTLAEARPDEPAFARARLSPLLAARQYEAALATADGLLAGYPQDLDGHLARAAACGGLGRADDARAAVEHAVAAALAAYRPGRADDYLSFLRRLADVAPQAAADAFARRRAAASDALPPALGHAQMLIALHRPQEAAAALAAVRRGDEDVSGRLAVLQLSAAALADTDDTAAAADALNALARESPDDLDTLNNLAYFLADRLNKPWEAAPYAAAARRALAASSDPVALATRRAAVLDTCGWVAFLNADPAAVPTLRAAVLADPRPSACLHLALALERAGRGGEMRDAVAQGLRLAGPDDGPARARLLGLQNKYAAADP